MPWLFDVDREKKNRRWWKCIFKALANRFWLTSKSCLWFNKVVYGRPSIKWTSSKGNDMLLKVDIQFVKEIPLEMVIG